MSWRQKCYTAFFTLRSSPEVISVSNAYHESCPRYDTNTQVTIDRSLWRANRQLSDNTHIILTGRGGTRSASGGRCKKLIGHLRADDDVSQEMPDFGSDYDAVGNLYDSKSD